MKIFICLSILFLIIDAQQSVESNSIQIITNSGKSLPSLFDYWEMAKNAFWNLVSFLFGWDSQERSGQSFASEDVLFSLPMMDIPVTRSQLEGFVLDSVAVYKKWQNE